MEKILIVGNIYFRNKAGGLSGTEVRLAEIVKGWCDLGYEIHLWSGLSLREVFDTYEIKYIFHKGYVMEKDDQKFFTYIKLIPKLIKIPESLRDFSGIIYTPTEMLTNVLPAVKFKITNKLKIKWGCVVHWLPPLLWWQRRRSSFLNSLMFMFYERLGVFLAKNFADILLPVSEGTAEQLMHIGVPKNRYQAVCCGVDLRKATQYSQEVLEKKYDAIFIKRLQSTKGVFDLIEIWEKVVLQKPNAKLAIIGSGPAATKMEIIIENKKLKNNIVLLGAIFNEQVKYHEIGHSRIFVLPSYEENWAIVIGEAMAASLPVIAYQLKELDIVWGDNYEKIPLGDTTSFSNKIIELLENKAVYIKIRDKGNQFVQQYDWKKIASDEIAYIRNTKLI